MQALESEREEKNAQVELMRSTTKEELWKEDLTAFELAYKEWLIEEENAAKELCITQRNAQAGQRNKGVLLPKSRRIPALCTLLQSLLTPITCAGKGAVGKAKTTAKSTAKQASKPIAAKTAGKLVTKSLDANAVVASTQPKLASIFAAAQANKTSEVR